MLSRMGLSHRILTLALVAGLLVSLRDAGHAQTVSPNPTPTIITSAPATINAAGYYQLGANLSYNGTGATNDAIITINANNVTLDLGGHFISGPVSNAGTTLFGIYANEKANLIIQNGTVAHCEFGIYLDGNGSATTNNRNERLQNLLVTACTVGGIFSNYPSYTVVSGCTINTIGGSTIAGQNASGVFFNSPHGTGTSGTGNQCNGNTVTNITCSSSSSSAAAAGLACDYGTTTMTGNVVTGVSDTNIPANAYGLFSPSFAEGNQIINCYTGIFSAVKYKDNLTTGCNTPFNGGASVGTNN